MNRRMTKGKTSILKFRNEEKDEKDTEIEEGELVGNVTIN